MEQINILKTLYGPIKRGLKVFKKIINLWHLQIFACNLAMKFLIVVVLQASDFQRFSQIKQLVQD